MSNPPKATQPDPGATALADLKVCEATGNLWVKLEAEAAAGNTKVENFLVMFRPFATERLGRLPKS